MRRIKFSFEGGGTVYATLLEEKAPLTCERVWNSLPFESVAIQSRWSGREFNFSYKEADLPPRENQTIYTSIGEVCYWRDWNWEEEGTLPQVLAIYYGAEVARSHQGHEPVNVFAQVDYGDFEKLLKIGERIWLEGKEKIFIDKCEE